MNNIASNILPFIAKYKDIVEHTMATINPNNFMFIV